MPLVYSPAEIEAAIAAGVAPGPFNSTTPAKSTGVFVQNISPFNLVLSSSLGSVQLPPAFTGTLPMLSSDGYTVTPTLAPGAVFPSTVVPYVDISYAFAPNVVPGGNGLVILPAQTVGDQIGVNVVQIGSLASGTYVANAAQTASFYGPAMTAPAGARGLILTIAVNAVSGTNPTLGLYMAAVDPVTGDAVEITTSAPTVSSAGLYTYVVYPGTLTSYTGSSAAEEMALPTNWKVGFNISGTLPSFTFSVGYQYVN